MVAEWEEEIALLRREEYWTLDANLTNEDKTGGFTARFLRTGMEKKKN